jgi:hypothetical protein
MLLGAEMCHLGSMTGLGNFGEFSSTQWLARVHSYMVEDANHMEVCKEHPGYKLLLQSYI